MDEGKPVLELKASLAGDSIIEILIRARCPQLNAEAVIINGI